MTLSTLSSGKVLLLHANAGAGHRKAAEAVWRGLQDRGVGSARCIDALEYTNPLFRRSYPAGYEFIVGKLPKVWGYFFKLTDKPSLQPLVAACRRVYNGLNAGPLVRFVTGGDFGVIVTTHFLSTEVVGKLRASGRLPRTRLVTLVTDYDVHRIWLSPGVDLYCVATEHTRRKMLELGVPAEKVAVTGIPVDEKFVVARDPGATRRALGLDPARFTVLLSTSSFGFGPIEELSALLADTQMVIICGNNRDLFARLTARNNPGHKVCGFVANMEEMMAAADLMVTKPGGLTITEALANRLPLIFFSAIPGQEAGNVRVLADHGIGMSERPLPEIAAEVRRLAGNAGALAEARARCAALARPDSVERIIGELARCQAGVLNGPGDRAAVSG